MRISRPLLLVPLAACCLMSLNQQALAHPHVWVEANVEIVRNEKGEATHIRHVWRFDEIFSTSLLLDFDTNGNEKLDQDELDEIAKVTRESLAEYNFYTEVRNKDSIVDFFEPEPYIADYQDNQLSLILSLELTVPQEMTGNGFKVAVSDPTYYVAVEMTAADPVLVSGGSTECTHEIVVPDWDTLYARDAERLTDLFAAGPDDKVEGSEDYLTWITFNCAS